MGVAFVGIRPQAEASWAGPFHIWRSRSNLSQCGSWSRRKISSSRAILRSETRRAATLLLSRTGSWVSSWKRAAVRSNGTSTRKSFARQVGLSSVLPISPQVHRRLRRKRLHHSRQRHQWRVGSRLRGGTLPLVTTSLAHTVSRNVYTRFRFSVSL
jgi:hypothetical protein